MNSNSNEMWKPIPGYCLYEVSNQGRVKSHHKNKTKMLSLSQGNNGYISVSLYRKVGVYKRKLVHRLVLSAHLGESDLDCNHKNGLKHDNRLENLEWCSKSYNLLHRSRVLGKVRGESNPGHKLTEEQVREIFRLGKIPNANKTKLGRGFGISNVAVDHILLGRNWQYLNLNRFAQD